MMQNQSYISNKAKEGDSLKVAMKAYLNGETFELHSHDEIELRLGSAQFDPQYLRSI